MIPWLVITSTHFYKLFGSLKTCLDKQPVMHKSVGEYLTVLKMLLAKLKVYLLPTSIQHMVMINRHAVGVHWIVGFQPLDFQILIIALYYRESHC